MALCCVLDNVRVRLTRGHPMMASGDTHRVMPCSILPISSLPVEAVRSLWQGAASWSISHQSKGSNRAHRQGSKRLGTSGRPIKRGDDATLSSRVRHLATFFVVERTVVMLASGQTLHLRPEFNEFVHQLMVNGVLNLHSLPEEILQDVCSRFRQGQK